MEVFFARDAALSRYFCVELDPLGRVHDYAASLYRKFDSSWNCPGLRARGGLSRRIHGRSLDSTDDALRNDGAPGITRGNAANRAIPS